ncbi:MAG: VOC family protein [Niastella sp.]|nr:VOC family protein [Niastella sp.]
MSNINNTIAGLEFAQIGWVVPDIHAAVKFLSKALGIAGFPEPQHVRAQDLNMTYHGKVVPAEWLTTQTYNGGSFIELVQPLSGQSMFHDYLAKYPAGGTQHLAFRLPVSDFERITSELREQGYAVVSEVDHPIARMAFFDTYQTLGVVTEIMGITPEGWAAIKQMEQAGQK